MYCSAWRKAVINGSSPSKMPRVMGRKQVPQTGWLSETIRKYLHFQEEIDLPRALLVWGLSLARAQQNPLGTRLIV